MPNETMARELASIIKYDSDNFNGRPGVADFGEPYRVYKVDLSKIRALRPNRHDASASIIESDFDWEYPLLDREGKIVCSYILTQVGAGSWFGTGKRNVATDSVEFSSAPEELDKYLVAQGIAGASTKRHFRISALGRDFYFIDAPQGQFLMPLRFNSGADEQVSSLELENKKLYKASEALRAIADIVEENPNIDASGNPSIGDIGAAGFVGASPKSTAPQEVNELMSKEIPNIIKEFRDGPAGIGISGFSQLPYRVYSVNLAKAQALGADYGNYIEEAIGSIIAGDYGWEYPLLDSKGEPIAAAVVRKFRGSWRMHPAIENVSAESIRLGSNPDELLALLERQGVRNIKTIKRFRIVAMSMDFIYVGADQGQYLLPLDLAPKGYESDRLDLENEKLYPAAEVMAKIIERANSDESISPAGEEIASGDEADSKKNKTTEKNLAKSGRQAGFVPILASLLVLLGTAFIVIMLRRKYRRD